MININNLSLQYGDKHIFKEISCRLNPMERVGLVGVNGTGKSTLMKILAGVTETDHGVVSRAKRVTLGYLPQEIQSFAAGRTIYQEAKEAFADLLAAHQELEETNRLLGSTDPEASLFAELLEKQGELQQVLDASDFFQLRSKIEKVLIGLGFKEVDFDKECNSFSGGWLMRLMLAKLLLASPSYLFLDEPTNHLDIESLTWLEDFLKNYNGAMVIISHDRSFLDNLTATTWELSLGKLTDYRGNYSKYLEEKEVRMQVQRAAYNNQQAKIQQTMRFVNRFRAKSTKAKQVQSRVRQVAKMDRIELEESEQKVSFRFPPSAPSGRLALETVRLTKSYEQLRVFEEIDLQVNRGDKIAVVGVNGAGKSTLAKLLAGLIQADSGSIRFGHNVQLSYFGQHQAQDLSPGLTVLQTMETVESEHTQTGLRSLLGAFLFRGDEVDKKVMVLSGGEKSRLALAKMIATPANLLVMDEPTNHLDMMSQEILQEALAQYDGSIIVVSHNRHFLDSFVTKVLEIKDHKATLFHGNISDYLAKLRQQQEDEKTRSPHPAPLQKKNDSDRSDTDKSGEKKRQSNKEARQEKARARQERNKKLNPLKNKLGKLESEIENLENEKSDLELQLADPELYKDQEIFAEKSKSYKRIDDRLKRRYSSWEELQEKIEVLEEDLA